MYGYEFYVDPSRCIGCQACVKACEECDTHRGRSMINFDFIDRPETIGTAAYVCRHCEDPHLRRGVSRGRDQEGRGRYRSIGAEAALHCVFELRARVPVRYSEDRPRIRADD